MKRQRIKMTRSQIRTIVIALGIAAVLVVSGFIYTRPVTIAELCPEFTAQKCTKIIGYYQDETGRMAEQKEFTIERGDEDFEKVYELFFERSYNRKLRDILPKGTRTRRVEPGDFWWDVYFVYDTVDTPDGNGHSGMLLKFRNWYGELNFSHLHDPDEHYYRTADQEAWLLEVLNAIR